MSEIKELKKQVKQQQKLINKLLAERKKEESDSESDSEETFNDDDFLFASDKSDTYNIKKMEKLYKDDSTKGKQYIRKYFAPLKNSTSILMFEPSKNEFIVIARKEIEHYVGSYQHTTKTDTGKEIVIWSPVQYITKTVTTRYLMTTNVKENKVVFEDKKTNLIYINTFKGYMHTEYKSFTSYPTKIQKSVNKIWEHIKIAWCSRNKDQFNYIKNCICKFIAGHKLNVCLYIKGIEGLGKSIIMDFLRKFVIGEHNSYVVTDPSCFLPDRFNSQLIGKLLLILEEVPSASSNTWTCLYNALKNWITGDTIEHKKKYCDIMQMINVATLFLISNNKAINIGENDRRYFMPDVSTEFVGNAKYFNDLSFAIENPKVGEAFFWYCHEHYEKNKDFNESDPKI
ncbi:MAG: hypothetical protein KF880_09400 [Ferruginibacter sp.]|nr:hypothetical protein [Ferruginibacter sp.]